MVEKSAESAGDDTGDMAEPERRAETVATGALRSPADGLKDAMKRWLGSPLDERAYRGHTTTGTRDATGQEKVPFKRPQVDPNIGRVVVRTGTPDSSSTDPTAILGNSLRYRGIIPTLGVAALMGHALDEAIQHAPEGTSTDGSASAEPDSVPTAQA